MFPIEGQTLSKSCVPIVVSVYSIVGFVGYYVFLVIFIVVLLGALLGKLFVINIRISPVFKVKAFPINTEGIFQSSGD